MHTVVSILAVLLCAPRPASSRPDDCNFAPFTFKDGTPMPGMRDGQLDFLSGAICASLTQSLDGRLTQASFLARQAPASQVDDVVPLGGGLMAPSSKMGCRSSEGTGAFILFEDGELLLTASESAWPTKLVVDALLDLQPRRGTAPSLPLNCKMRYRRALLAALYPRRTAYTEADLLDIAAATPDTCAGTDFRDALRGIAIRSSLTWITAPFVWARFSQCSMMGYRHKADEVTLSLSCPWLPGQVIARLATHDVQAFIGANNGMTADATIHPMDATCLGAWEIWRTRPLEPDTP
ncbi:MAG: hypothetical protein ACI9U2_003570 [Bradymonadia bacterium]|jgi:hypothetical protein